jgi:hypothetical protein
MLLFELFEPTHSEEKFRRTWSSYKNSFAPPARRQRDETDSAAPGIRLTALNVL